MQCDKEKISCSETKKALRRSVGKRREKSGEPENTARRILGSRAWELFPAAVPERAGYAYLTRGLAAGIVGGAAVTAMIVLIYGIRSAVRGFKEREKSYLTCKIGLPANALVLLVFLAIFIGGMKG